MQKELWDIQKLVEHYPVFTEWGVRWLVRNRRIPIVRIGSGRGRIFFDPDEISSWIDRRKQKEVEG